VQENGHADAMDGVETAVDRRFEPLAQRLDDELREGGKEVDQEVREKQRELVNALPLDK
jgi:N-acetyltransferase 10